MSSKSSHAAQVRYRAKHKAKIAAKSKARYEAHIDARRAKAKARRAANPAEGRKASLAWYRRNKAKAYAKHKAWRLGKLANVGSMVGARKPFALISAEVAKCDLVCANCHRLRTHKTRKR